MNKKNIYRRIIFIMIFFAAMVYLNGFVEKEDTFMSGLAKTATVGCAAAFTYNFIRIVDERD